MTSYIETIPIVIKCRYPITYRPNRNGMSTFVFVCIDRIFTEKVTYSIYNAKW